MEGTALRLYATIVFTDHSSILSARGISATRGQFQYPPHTLGKRNMISSAQLLCDPAGVGSHATGEFLLSVTLPGSRPRSCIYDPGRVAELSIDRSGIPRPQRGRRDEHTMKWPRSALLRFAQHPSEPGSEPVDSFAASFGKQVSSGYPAPKRTNPQQCAFLLLLQPWPNRPPS